MNASNDTLQEVIDEWNEDLGLRLKLHLQENNITQSEMADTLGYSKNSQVNQAIKRPAKWMSPSFVEKLSARVPGFEDAIVQLRELMDARYAPPVKMAEVMEKYGRKAQSVRKLKDSIEGLERMLKEELKKTPE